MKHASAQALASLDSFLSEVRLLPGITEKKTGIFYKSSKALLHFHEDAAGIFADARIEGQDFTRFSVNSEHEIAVLLSVLRERLK